MARTFTGTAGTGGTALSIDGGLARRVYVKNTDATSDLQVNIPVIHGTSYDILEPGDSPEYESDNGSITVINVKTATGTATYTAGVTAGAASGVGISPYDGLAIRGAFNAGSTVSSLSVSFSTGAPTVSVMRDMILLPTSGNHTGYPIRVKSVASEGAGVYTVTPYINLNSDSLPADGDLFVMGFTPDMLARYIN